MSDTLYREGPGSPATIERETLSGARVTLAHAAPLARFVFRGDAAAAERAGAALGTPLPTTPLAATHAGERAALWLGPDEWLLLARVKGVVTVDATDRLAATLAAKIAAELAGMPHSLVDVSERNVALVIEGEGAAERLNAHVFLDLAPEAFPVGMVTRTLFAKAEIVLWRVGEAAFVVECWRSFAPYVEGLLIEG